MNDSVQKLFDKYLPINEGFIPDLVEGCETNADQRDATQDFAADHITDHETTISHNPDHKEAAIKIAEHFFGLPEEDDDKTPSLKEQDDMAECARLNWF